MDFYEVLEINNDADYKEIKKAYARMVRKFPPETNPEEYNKIREAYEVLSSPDKKAEYDAHSKYSVEIEKFLDSASISIDNEDYESAIRDYKKILLLEPNLNYVKNYLALAYGYNEQYDECINLLKELIEAYPDTAYYHYNIAHAYAFKDQNEEAIYHWIKTVELDPSYEDATKKLVDFYVKIDRLDDAISFLRSKATSINNIFYFLELLNLYINCDNYEMLEPTVKEIFNLSSSDNLEEKAQICYEIGKFAYDLKGPFTIKASITILEALAAICPEDEDSANLLKSRKEREYLANQYIKFCKDSKYEDCLVKYIYMNVSSPDFSDEEYKEKIDKIIEELEAYIKSDSSKFIDMLTALKKEYISLYNLQNEYFDDLMSFCLLWKNRKDNLSKFKSDRQIPKVLKDLINLWLTENISAEERDTIFNKINENIVKTDRRAFLKGLKKLKNNYKEYYSLNDEYIDSLIKSNEDDTTSSKDEKKSFFSKLLSNAYFYAVVIFLLLKLIKYFW